MSETPQRFPSSPSWSKNTKLFVWAAVAVFFVAALITFSQLFLYILLALVVSLVLRPIVDFVERRLTNVPRWLSTAAIYLALLGGLLAFPISTVPSLINQVVDFFVQFPQLVEQVVNSVTELLREPIVILGGRYTIPIDEINNEQLQQYLGELVSVVASSVTSVNTLLLNITSLTVNFISRMVLVLFLSFYFTKDGHKLAAALLRLAPNEYHDDMHHLMFRANLIWGAFLRGQVILMITVGFVVFVIASALGLPNPVALGVIAGLMEIVPYAGPVLAALPAGILAWFQHDASWLGVLMSPFWFTVITLSAYWLVQQIENYFLVPRILGHQLKLHPAFVFVAAIAGFQLAGVFGIFLASPTLATLRLGGKFVYGKLTDQTMGDMVASPVPEQEAASAEKVSSPTPIKTPPQPADPVPTAVQPAVLRVDSGSTSQAGD